MAKGRERKYEVRVIETRPVGNGEYEHVDSWPLFTFYSRKYTNIRAIFMEAISDMDVVHDDDVVVVYEKARMAELRNASGCPLLSFACLATF